MTEASPLSRAAKALTQPVDIASLAAFRILFGGLLFVGFCRFMAEGWVEPLYVEPSFFFKYKGFEWVTVPPRAGLYLLWSSMAALALLVSLGLFYRLAVVALLALFTYAQLLDVTNYLNHYQLVILLLAFMTLMPLSGALSLDARLRPHLRRATLPRWMLTLLKLQVAVVYISAGLAKATSEWLLYAQPMNIWMSARSELPIIGPLLDELWVAYGMSWGGFLYDTFIVFFLLKRRTRPYAYAVVICFHGLTGIFFDIGLFPWIMTIATTLYFDPSWPRKLLCRLGFVKMEDAHLPDIQAAKNAAHSSPSRPRIHIPVLIGAYGILALLTPHRHYLYPGEVLWHEQGMRYAWKVMLREKSGSVTYFVDQKETGRTWRVSPSEYLTWRQANEFCGQPDLILQLAHHIEEDFNERGLGPVAVRAEALVSLNGRPAEAMIDPTVDLSNVRDSLSPYTWVKPSPSSPPVQLKTPTLAWPSP